MYQMKEFRINFFFLYKLKNNMKWNQIYEKPEFKPINMMVNFKHDLPTCLIIKKSQVIMYLWIELELSLINYKVVIYH